MFEKVEQEIGKMDLKHSSRQIEHDCEKVINQVVKNEGEDV